MNTPYFLKGLTLDNLGYYQELTSCIYFFSLSIQTICPTFVDILHFKAHRVYIPEREVIY